jgi:TfoX/Sxy family transcriptional regulator of competence genes
LKKALKTKLVTNGLNNPIYSNNPSWVNLSYDKVDSNSTSDTPVIMRWEEELALEDAVYSTY